jgi:general secretion pathway protein E
LIQSVLYNTEEKIGEMLLRLGKIKQDQLDRALGHQDSVTNRIAEILISLGFISEDDLAEVLAEQLHLPLYKSEKNDLFLAIDISPMFHRVHPFALVRRGIRTILLLSDPLDLDILSTAELLFENDFELHLTHESNIKKIVDEHYGLTVDDGEGDDLSVVDESDIDKLKDMASEAPVIKYVNTLIDTAITRRASDIHMEPFDDGLQIRFRVDGILQDYEIPPLSMQAAIISRTKLLASLDIAERRIPQDGKISLRISGKEIDLRVSTMPSVYGEGVVIRILEKASVILEMTSLGMKEELESEFQKVIAIPNGIVLVTGPTGSGKTTTLYCALNHINSGANKIITLEDPVEYQLHGINQIQVRPEVGLTFAKGLRSIVRQDPDVIMVGEIRDLETAEIAVQSSLTGHLVFSTLHTNDSISAVFRMIDLGVERFLLASSLRGILAQRLVRRICQDCRQAAGKVSDFLTDFSDDFEVFEGRGCPKCSNSGYTGRKGLYELLVIDNNIGRGISQGMDLVELQKAAVDNGFITMFNDGIIKVRQGETTLAEVMRVSRGIGNAII